MTDNKAESVFAFEHNAYVIGGFLLIDRGFGKFKRVRSFCTETDRSHTGNKERIEAAWRTKNIEFYVLHTFLGLIFLKW